MLLDGADAYDDDGGRLVLQPVLERGAGELPEPEPTEPTILGHT